MIECIFTLDYEIYGDGTGSLQELVYEPTERLKVAFRNRGARFVVFVEVAELEMIEAKQTDPAIDMVKKQIQDLHSEGFEVGLHIHPWWYNARHENGSWSIDYSNYNLCTLPEQRINEIIDRSLTYLRRVLELADFTPFSYRSGHLLFQPTRAVANILSDRGIKVDSSVYKGGLWRQHKLDYRPALKNGYYWRFADYVNKSEADGALMELPIHTTMVPTWEMLTAKRIGLQRKASSVSQSGKKVLNHLTDYLRFRRPLKFDFCAMTSQELRRMVDQLVTEDQRDPALLKPIVAIGHTKDLVDLPTIEAALSYLEEKGIKVTTFQKAYCLCEACQHGDGKRKL